MTETKFTPAPWTLNNKNANHGYYITDSDDFETICDLYFIHPNTKNVVNFTNSEANANLIASAPEMYKALKIAQSVIHQLTQDSLYDNAKEIISDSLKRARGEK